MAVTTTHKEAVRFRGPPHRLLMVSAFALEAAPTALEPGTELARAVGALARAPRLKGAARDGDLAGVRIKLDRATPPGTYEATLDTAAGRYPVQIEVEPSPWIRATPAEIVFDAPAGGEAHATVTLANRGNVAVEVPETITLGVYDDDGLENAFASTYRLEKVDDLNKVLAHFFGKLREGHGGLMKIRVASGAGALPPAAIRVLQLRLPLPAKLPAGHSFHGVWTLETLNCSVRVVVRKPQGGQREKV